MFRFLITLLLPLALLCLMPATAGGQWVAPQPTYGPTWTYDELEGTWINASNRGRCLIYRTGWGYVFVNENGSRATFAYAAPGQLRMMSGEWDPNITVSMIRDPNGRMVLRFDAPYTRTGYWVKRGF